MPTDSQRRNLASAHHAEVQALNERIELLEQDNESLRQQNTELDAQLARLEAIESAARNLVKVKGRYHTEQAFKALAAAITSTQETP